MGSYTGGTGPDSFAGTNGNDTFLLQSGGDDTASGLDGDDGFYFGAALSGADSVDGGAGSDTIAIQGDYSAGLALGDLRNAEVFLLLSGGNASFGDTAGNRYSYNITTNDTNVAAGQTLTLISTGLQSNESVTFNGAAESDGNFRIYAGTGTDAYTGGAGSDGFFFGADDNLTGADRIDGGGGVDTVALRGWYADAPFHPNNSVYFDNASLTNVEVLALLSGHTNEFTGVIAPDGFDYAITMADGNVAAGARLDINGVSLGADETVFFDGHAETDGAYRILSGAGSDGLIGGQGADIIFGGLGADTLTGNGGNDTFLYHSVAESTSTAKDFITDFAVGDVIDLGSIDANSLTDAKESFTFVGANAFSGAAGELRATSSGGSVWLIEADVNGDGVADMAINARVTTGYTIGMANSQLIVVPVPTTPVIAEIEPNDSTSSAQAIDRGLFGVANNPDLVDPTLPSATIRANIATPSDVDYYTITLNAGERLILDVDHSPAGGVDALVTVYAPGGAQVAQDDDPGFDDPGSDPNGAYAQDPHTTDSMLAFRAQTSGTYTFTVEAFKDPDHPETTTHGSYDLQVSIGPAVSAAQIQEENIEALISGAQWPQTALTYSFPTSTSDYPDYPANSEIATFHAFNIAQQATARTNFANLSALTDLSFSELTSNRGSAVIRYGMSDKTDLTTAYAFYPTTSPSGGFGDPIGGDAWFRFSGSKYSNPVLGNYAYVSIIHETGHALGLKHGHEFPFALSPDRDSLEYSVMTYRSFPGASLDGYRNETFGYPQTYMMYDIAALQRMYGADFTTNAGDTVYSWSTTTGQMSINGVGQGMPGANRVFMTIWDGGGNDTYDLSNYGNPVTIDLRPGEWTTTSQIQLANLGLGHMARGNVANALLYNNDPHSLIENAIGGAAGDTLIANQAVNHLTGNGGADTFRWAAVTDSAPGQADTIDDFQNGTDRIDLSALDADTRTPGDEGFHWIGSAAFSGAGGELRGEVIDGNLHIFGDVNADAVPDFEIIIAHQTTIDPSVFIV
ncbi:MAG: hypothetical protein JWP15_54 [Alphaproteobacteria bacterium]|nr:hypothetical protein [Alphaproteobacteria bacterium]